MEHNDIYDEHRRRTGRVHRRGEEWAPGEFGLVVTVWVYDGAGRVLMTRRAPGKSFAGTWENSGGAALAGETSLVAIVRELYEETGIRAQPEEFELLDTTRDPHFFYDHYCLHRRVALADLRLQPGETDSVKWATFGEVREMIRRGEICQVIANQFLQEEPKLMARQSAQE